MVPGCRHASGAGRGCQHTLALMQVLSNGVRVLRPGDARPRQRRHQGWFDVRPRLGWSQCASKMRWAAAVGGSRAADIPPATHEAAAVSGTRAPRAQPPRGRDASIARAPAPQGTHIRGPAPARPHIGGRTGRPPDRGPCKSLTPGLPPPMLQEATNSSAGTPTTSSATPARGRAAGRTIRPSTSATQGRCCS